MYDKQNEQRLNAMKLRILKAEHENLKLQRSTGEMVEQIRNIIRDEANKIIYGGKQYAD